jgi:rhodanese-related sulfurtransferase
MKMISVADLKSAHGAPNRPLILDVRKAPAFRDSRETIAGALRRDPEAVAQWVQALPRGAEVVAYCVHGHEVSQAVAKALTAQGIRARYLDGGFAKWKAQKGAMDAKPAGASTRWVTRERPKIDRIACPWLVSRFVDRDAEFFYVPSGEVRDTAKAKDAVPYDVPEVHFTHEGERCSFDAFLRHYGLGGDPALERLALIVRGADTARLELAAQAPGLAAVSLGLSRLFADDHEMLRHGMVLYDALYAWCRDGQTERHTWNPQPSR